MCRKTVILVMFFKRKKSSNHKIPSPSEKKKSRDYRYNKGRGADTDFSVWPDTKLQVTAVAKKC